jgi:hypothetical protein
MSTVQEPLGSVLFKEVYYISCSDEEASHLRHSTAPLAIRPVINGRSHRAHWGTNSTRGDYVFYDQVDDKVERYLEDPRALGSRMLVLEKGPDEIVLTKENHTIRLLKLTAQLFEQKVRPFVLGGETLHFTDDDSVQKYFLETGFER